MMTRIPMRLRWRDWASLSLGTWLFASMWMFRYMDATLAVQNACVAGILLFTLYVEYEGGNSRRLQCSRRS
jgi:hypothetical protein